jgi:hypothetical protein
MLSDLPPIDRSLLAGRWYVQRTNFPMWLSGTRRRPAFDYRLVDGDPRLSDTVTYVTAGGAQKQIAGYDAQDPNHGAHFTWRGKGLLSLLSSDWYVVHLDADAGVAAIYFTRTLFTPAGVDVLARVEEAPATALEPALAALRATPESAGMVDTLRPVHR